MTRWTEDEDKTLRQMWADGRSARVIAVALDRTPDSVGSRLKRLKLSREGDPVRAINAWTDAENDALERLVSEGHSLGEIAAAMGKTRGAVSSKVRRMAFKKGPWSDEEVATLRQLRADGVKVSEISARLRRTLCSVNSKITQLRNKDSRAGDIALLRWTVSEDARILQGLRAQQSPKRIAQTLPQRKLRDVHARIEGYFEPAWERFESDEPPVSSLRDGITLPALSRLRAREAADGDAQ